jgi:hypothetical protein
MLLDEYTKHQLIISIAAIVVSTIIIHVFFKIFGYIKYLLFGLILVWLFYAVEWNKLFAMYHDTQECIASCKIAEEKSWFGTSLDACISNCYTQRRKQVTCVLCRGVCDTLKLFHLTSSDHCLSKITNICDFCTKTIQNSKIASAIM